MTLHLLGNASLWLSSGFLFSYYMARSLGGLTLAHRLEPLAKKFLLISLSGLFAVVLVITVVYTINYQFTIFSATLLALILGCIDSVYTAVVNAFIPKLVTKQSIDDAFRKTFLLQASIYSVLLWE